MFAKRSIDLGAERRKYIRIDTILPVQFRLESLDRKQSLSPWLQGFTNNIGHGGICLSVNNLSLELCKLVKEKKVKLSIEIDMPLVKNSIGVLVSVAWIKESGDLSGRYLIGLDYEQISAQQNNLLLRYVWVRRLFLPVIILCIALLSLVLVFGTYLNIQLTHKNKQLVEELVGVLEESKLAQQKMKQIAQEKGALQQKIAALALQIKSILSKKSEQALAAVDNTKALNEEILKLAQERDLLQAKLITLQLHEQAVQDESLRLNNKKIQLEKANLDKMLQWFKVHQNPRTGLIMSFEGDKDIAGWAFIYDQALLIQVYTEFSDFARAKKTLDFLTHNVKRDGGWFLNAYYVDDGSPAEFIMHSGPNIWLGIAMVQYIQKTGERNYLGMAEEIAQNIIKLQDVDGGIRGGPQMSWYSTEHNLDAYAFLKMLARVTNNIKYSQAADKISDWLVRHTYDRQDLPVKRGKGDSTIATDTYAWSIAAIGPEKLKTLGMDPDRIMDFVEENCKVEVNFNRPGGQMVKIQGFDFAPQRHISRGGVVSSEWTAQMVVAFKIMAEYYFKKGQVDRATVYQNKANNYLAQLGNMIISSPSPSGQGEGCLPYATQDYVDTGHGWMTPKGKHTGSVSGTAYTIFAYEGFNPLELKE